MQLEKYGVIELTQQEQLLENGGGPIGRIVGWFLGFLEVVGEVHQEVSKSPEAAAVYQAWNDFR